MHLRNPKSQLIKVFYYISSEVTCYVLVIRLHLVHIHIVWSSNNFAYLRLIPMHLQGTFLAHFASFLEPSSWQCNNWAFAVSGSIGTIQCSVIRIPTWEFIWKIYNTMMNKGRILTHNKSVNIREIKCWNWPIRIKKTFYSLWQIRRNCGWIGNCEMFVINDKDERTVRWMQTVIRRGPSSIVYHTIENYNTLHTNNET